LQRDAERLQQRCGPDARELEELRRIDRAAAQDHLATRADLDLRTIAATLAVADAHCLLALEYEGGGMRMGMHGEVGPLHRRMKIASRGTDTAAVADDALHVADACLQGAVVVRVARDPHFDRA